MEEKQLTEAIDNGVQPIMYFNPFNAKCRITAYEKHDPDGAATFTAQIEGHGEYSGLGLDSFFDDREPEFDETIYAPTTNWAWTGAAVVESLEDQIKGVSNE